MLNFFNVIFIPVRDVFSELGNSYIIFEVRLLCGGGVIFSLTLDHSTVKPIKHIMLWGSH